MAYITKEDISAIRNELKGLKKIFGKSLTFSVRNENHSSANITLTKWDEDLTSVLNDSGYAQVNHYYLREHFGDSRLTDLLEMVNEIAHNAPGRANGKLFYDNTDIMTDYFDTAWYISLNIGKWDKAYEQMA